MRSTIRPAACAMLARWVLATLAVTSSCGDQQVLTAPVSGVSETDLRIRPTTVVISPTPVSATVGDTGWYTAEVKDQWGRTMPNAIVAWSSRDTNVVRINATGFARAVGAGVTQVVARSGLATGLSDATITGASVASVDVSPDSAAGQVGDAAQFTATLYDANGNVLTGRAVTWTSSNPEAVTVDSTGFARAVGVGVATLSATADGVVGTAVTVVEGPVPPPPPPPPPAPPTVASVTVTPGSASGNPGDSAQFVAAATDSSGNPITDREVTWSTTDAAVVVVSASGMGRAVGPGSAALVATVDGVQGTSAITVVASAPPPPPPPPPPTPAAVASVAIAPANPSMDVGGGAQLAATLRDANGNVLTGRAIAWSSSNYLVAPVTADGYVTGLLAGSASVTASREGGSSATTATVNVLPPPPPPPPPPSGAWPNLPSAYSVMTDQPFDPSLLPGWDLIWNPVGNGRIANNLTAPFSGPSVFEVKYPAGFVAGSAPATQTYPLSDTRNLYVGMWFKANADWQGHDSNVNKIQFVFMTTGGNLYLTMYGSPGGPYHLRTNLQFSGADTRDWLVPNVSPGVVSLGEWHRIEWQMEFNTAGSANGVVRFWLDGQLVGNYTDVRFPGSGFGEYKLSPTWGGVGGLNKQHDDYFWFDHITINHR